MMISVTYYLESCNDIVLQISYSTRKCEIESLDIIDINDFTW